MAYLERVDALDRQDGTPRQQRLRQITPETGRFIALLAACAPPGHCVEIGTSAGYSALWLSLACRAVGRTLVTFEVLVSGGLLVADNAINHRETLAPMLGRALDDPRVDAMIVPVGKGQLVCRRR